MFIVDSFERVRLGQGTLPEQGCTRVAPCGAPLHVAIQAASMAVIARFLRPSKEWNPILKFAVVRFYEAS